MESAEDKLARLTAVATNVDSFCLHLNLAEVRQLATDVFIIRGRESTRVIEELAFESDPCTILVDRQTKSGREQIWNTLSDLYLQRLVAVNSGPAASSDYSAYVASLSTDYPTQQEQTTSTNLDRPLLTPSLGTTTISLMKVVWDDASMALCVECSGYVMGVNKSLIRIAPARQRDLVVLVGTHERSRPGVETRDDLIRRWKQGDSSKGDIQVLEMAHHARLKVDVRPVQSAEVLQDPQVQMSSTQDVCMPESTAPHISTGASKNFLPISPPIIEPVKSQVTTYPTRSANPTNDAPTSPPSTVSHGWSIAHSKHSPAISQPISPDTTLPAAVQPVPVNNKSPSQPLRLCTSAPAKPKRMRRKLQKRAKPV